MLQGVDGRTQDEPGAAAGWLRTLAAPLAALALLLAGCVPVAPPRAPAPEPTPPAPVFVPAVSHYQGMLPCADCAGVLTELTLRSDPAGEPGTYTLRQTWLATPAGDRSAVRAGRWSARRESDGIRYALEGDDALAQRRFLVAAGGALQLLDAAGQPLPPQLPQLLKPTPELPVSLILADAGRLVELPVGGRLVLRLALQAGTGYRWTLADDGGAVLAQEGEPDTVPAPAAAATVGAGGWQVFRFQALRPGRQTLRFEYRRPWEQRPPAQVAEFTIAVPAPAAVPGQPTPGP